MRKGNTKFQNFHIMKELPLRKAMKFTNKIRHIKLLIKISTIVDLMFLW